MPPFPDREVASEIKDGARFLIVGEAPGAEEERAGKPFIGLSGKFLDGALALTGYARKDFNITNVVPWRPPGNEIDLWFKKGEPNEYVQEGIRRLDALIRATRPVAIIALGNTALWALTGHRHIMARRGSVYQYNTTEQRDGDGLRTECVASVVIHEHDQQSAQHREDEDDVPEVGWAADVLRRSSIPVLACLHPAAVLREPTLANLFARDCGRFRLVASGDLDGSEPPRTLKLWPSSEDLQEALERCLATSWVAVDIETGQGKLQCVGFAPSPDWSICIPADTPERLNVIRMLLANDTPKIFHNAPYDVPYLVERCCILVNGVIHDTLAMSQALYPELPRDLGTLTSLYTFQPYYKDLGVIWKATSDYTSYWKYNALDCACTREIAEVLQRKLIEKDLWKVYERTLRVLPHALHMSMRGVKYDTAEATKLSTKLTREQHRFQRILDGRAGKPINVNSNPQVTALLYDQLQLPVRRKRGTAGRPGDQKSILGLYPAVTDRRTRQCLRALLGVRHTRKLLEGYLSIAPSDDGRMRSSFNPAGTETGRWTASKYLIDQGVNLQTVTPRWKSCFVADPGQILFNCDYSQIEARLVSYLANDARSIKIFESGGDIHRENAAVIFGKAPDKISAKEREIGKTVHALNYGVGIDTLMETVNKRALDTGLWMTRDLARFVKTTYLNNFDQVVRWQEMTWETVQKTRELTNPFGRRRIFIGPTRGAGAEHTKKEALAFVPQSTVPDLLNEALVALRVTPPAPGVEILLNIHDALFGQGPEETVDQWLSVISSTMQRPFLVGTHSLVVPVDRQVGKSWGSLTKLPRL